jgi:hypothetical protein
LEKRNEGDTDETKRHKSLEKITDDDYDFVIQQLKGETTLTFEQYVLRIRTREQQLESTAGKATKAKARRNKLGDGNQENCPVKRSPKFQDLFYTR